MRKCIFCWVNANQIMVLLSNKAKKDYTKDMIVIETESVEFMFNITETN